METKAKFSEIKKEIEHHISKCKSSIKISVAWFTNKDLLGQLTDKIEKGCKIEIIISDDFGNNNLSFKRFIDAGGQVFIMQTKKTKFLHDKFAIFDNSKLIAGSYNWTNAAEYYNHEFIIQSTNVDLLKQFYFHFNNLKKYASVYSKKLLTNNAELSVNSNETEFIELEKELNNRFLDSISKANKIGANINADRVISFLQKYGAIGGAKRLISQGTENLQSGLVKLWEINKLDLSFESIILQEKFSKLFSEEILKKAEKRLNEFNNQ